MAIVDATGVRSQSLSDHRSDLERRFREAFGDDLILDPETPQGQIIGIWAQMLAENDEQVVAQGNALSIDQAEGVQLTDLGTNLDIMPGEATRSRVTATLTGVAGTRVPANSRARNEDGAQFRTREVAVLSPQGVQVEMESVDEGAVAMPAGELTIIVTLVPGWETVTNASAAALGSASESDPDYRARYQRRTANSATGPKDALRAALTEAGATQVRVELNDSSAPRTVQGITLQPYSVIAIVRGGTDADLREAMLRAKGMGVSPQTVLFGGTHSALAALQGITNGSLTWRGATFTGLDLSGDAAFADMAAAVQTLILTSDDALTDQTQVLYQWHADGNFAVGYPWRPDSTPAFDAGTTAVALGLSPALATESPGPFVRARERALSVTATVAITRGVFPADGLNQIRNNVLTRASLYGIGQRPWANDLLLEVERVLGTRATSFAVEDEGTAINSVTMPLTDYYTLASSDLEITITQDT